MFPDNSVALPAALIVATIIIATLPIYYTWYGTLNERFFISTFQSDKGLRPSPFLLMVIILAIYSLLFLPNLALATCALGIIFFLTMKFFIRKLTLGNIPNYLITVFPIEFFGIFLFLNIVMYMGGSFPHYFQ